MAAYRPLLLKAGGWSLLGLSGYLTADAVNDLVLYRTLLRLALAQAEEHPLIKEQLGLPLTAGPWYNSSVDLTHAGHIASCKFKVSGQTSASDVLVRAVRRGGMRSTLLYNTIGRGEWEVLQLDASVAAGGGLSRRVSLLDRAVPPAPEADAHGLAGGKQAAAMRGPPVGAHGHALGEQATPGPSAGAHGPAGYEQALPQPLARRGEQARQAAPEAAGSREASASPRSEAEADALSTRGASSSEVANSPVSVAGTDACFASLPDRMTVVR